MYNESERRNCTAAGRTDHDGLAATQLHGRRPGRDEAVLAAADERAVGGRAVEHAQDGVAVRSRTRLGRQLEADVASSHVRVLRLAVLELHVRAELVPRDGALRRTVDLLKQRLDLTLLSRTQLDSSSYFSTPLSRAGFSLSRARSEKMWGPS